MHTCKFYMLACLDKYIPLYLSVYLLQITILGKFAFSIGSVDEVRLVETVAVENCFTVLERKNIP